MKGDVYDWDEYMDCESDAEVEQRRRQHCADAMRSYMELRRRASAARKPRGTYVHAKLAKAKKRVAP